MEIRVNHGLAEALIPMKSRWLKEGRNEESALLRWAAPWHQRFEITVRGRCQALITVSFGLRLALSTARMREILVG